MSDTSLNIPQLVALVVIGFLAIRWFMSPASPASGAPGAQAGSRNTRRINPAQVDQVAAMFPQLNRRDIMWDLQRNGGNVQATIERVLAGRGLDTPPPSFQPTPPPSAAPASTTGGSSTPAKPSHPDLITRYKLADRVAQQKQEEEATSSATPQKKDAWSASKSERQALLQKRREEMILAARRKMEAKDKGKTADGGS